MGDHCMLAFTGVDPPALTTLSCVSRTNPLCVPTIRLAVCLKDLHLAGQTNLECRKGNEPGTLPQEQRGGRGCTLPQSDPSQTLPGQVTLKPTPGGVQEKGRSWGHWRTAGGGKGAEKERWNRGAKNITKKP